MPFGTYSKANQIERFMNYSEKFIRKTDYRTWKHALGHKKSSRRKAK